MVFLIRILVNAAALFVATRVVPGITIGLDNSISNTRDIETLLIVALIFGLVNAVIKPILATLTCPLYILTLGLFTFVVNALMLLLASWIATQLGFIFTVDGFAAALVGAIVISIVSFILSAVIGEERKPRPSER